MTRDDDSDWLGDRSLQRGSAGLSVIIILDFAKTARKLGKKGRFLNEAPSDYRAAVLPLQWHFRSFFSAEVGSNCKQANI